MQPDGLHKTRVAVDDCRLGIQCTFRTECMGGGTLRLYRPHTPARNHELVTGRIIARNARSGSRRAPSSRCGFPAAHPHARSARQVAASCSAAPPRLGETTPATHHLCSVPANRSPSSSSRSSRPGKSRSAIRLLYPSRIRRHVSHEDPETSGRNLAFSIRLKLDKVSGEREILPVGWQDNYFSLPPAERSDIDSTYEPPKQVQRGHSGGKWMERGLKRSE